MHEAGTMASLADMNVTKEDLGACSSHRLQEGGSV